MIYLDNLTVTSLLIICWVVACVKVLLLVLPHVEHLAASLHQLHFITS